LANWIWRFTELCLHQRSALLAGSFDYSLTGSDDCGNGSTGGGDRDRVWP